jgi:GDPmannose 4,6-dehydratase
MFGNTIGPFNERSRFAPVSPYGIAKLAAHHTAVMYREAYGLHVSCGILFNHDGPRRGETFVTRKIAKAAARISMGKQDKLCLGDLMPKRDWGFAAEYVDAMWLMLQQHTPSDYVIATGQSHSVQEFLDMAFACAGLSSGPHVVIDSRYMRPHEIEDLVGDATKAHSILGWYPRTLFKELVRLMVDHEMREAGR